MPSARTRIPALLLAAGLAAPGLTVPAPAGADGIALPARALERNGPVELRYRPDAPPTAGGRLEVEWRDALGRLVERRSVRVAPTRATRIPFRLDLRRAVATGNSVQARLVPGRRGAAPAPAARASFPAPPPAAPWSDWQTVIWQPRNPAQLAALKRMGVTAGVAPASRDDAAPPPPAAVEDQVAPFLRQDLRWYVENIATDFYAAYHRWAPDAPANAAFLKAKELHRADPQGTAAFVRSPSLSDPVWLRRIRDRLVRTVRAHAPYRPLYYDLADEPGVADLAAAWDFDLSPASLAGMRAWLRAEYGGLDALNRQWGTGFARWDQVVPPTTDQAMRRADENFSGWADFKAWMDVAFARAIRAGSAAVHAADPRARSAIEGAQIPGWGGYDYARLAGAVDVMEIYDAGRSLDIARSLDPSLVPLTTLYGGGAQATHDLWRAVLRGARGVILWDENDGLVGRDGAPGAWGREIAPVLAELRDGLGSLLINSRRQVAPVAMLYSPPSFRVQWMLDRKAAGPAWAARDAAAEYRDATVAAATEGFARLLGSLGLEPRFVSPEDVGRGALRGGAYRVLILPRAVALSPAEATAIRRFVGSGGTAVADVAPGLFDQRGRRLDRAALADLFPAGPDGRAPAGRGAGPGGAVLFAPGPAGDPGTLERFRLLLRRRAHVEPGFVLRDQDGGLVGDVEVRRYRNGGTTILALLRDAAPGPAAAGGRAAGGPVVLTLPRPRFVRDVRARRALGRVARVSLALDPAAPTILALSEAAPTPPEVAAPTRLAAGREGGLRIRLPGVLGAGAARTVHVGVVDPCGTPRLEYSGNLVVRGDGHGRWRLPLALGDPPGVWRAWVTDVAGGRRAVVPFRVLPARRPG